ncbi:MAG: AraC family ligand binding domain-containing protein [bacterium]|nr:AraC family ligand binding domain-containing protein [Candidatus Kapabacteria bacterium]
MKVIDVSPSDTEHIDAYASSGAHSMKLADGFGESHVYYLHFESNSIIGEHEAGFGQLFVVIEGSGWVAGADGARIPIQTGQTAVIERGEMHSKGSDPGMTVVMIQMRNMAIV